MSSGDTLRQEKGKTTPSSCDNRTAERVGVVIAVDGRNIISGKKSDLKHTEDMYIVDGYGQARYDGWRTDRDTVHRFYFTDTADSYSMRTFEDSSAMGVIAVAVYREKERPEPIYDMKRKNSAQPAPAFCRESCRQPGPGRKGRERGHGFWRWPVLPGTNGGL